MIAGASGALLATTWVIVVVWGAWRFRPRSGRLSELRTGTGRHDAVRHPPSVGTQTSTEPPVLSRAAELIARPVTFTGRGVRRLAGLPKDDSADLRFGLALVATGATAAFSIALAAPVAVAVWWAPALIRRRVESRRSGHVLDELPDAVDLLRLSLGSGTSVRLALATVAPRCGPTIGGALGAVNLQLQRGVPMADALLELCTLGESFQPVLDALVLADRHGAPITPLLDRVADDARGARRRRAEEVARRVPVKLLFPLVFCTLPAFGLLTVVPLLASAMARFSL